VRPTDGGNRDPRRPTGGSRGNRGAAPPRFGCLGGIPSGARRETFCAEGDPRGAKALLNLLIDELRVNSRAEILPTYRLVTPVVCAMSERVSGAVPERQTPA